MSNINPQYDQRALETFKDYIFDMPAIKKEKENGCPKKNQVQNHLLGYALGVVHEMVKQLSDNHCPYVQLHIISKKVKGNCFSSQEDVELSDHLFDLALRALQEGDLLYSAGNSPYSLIQIGARFLEVAEDLYGDNSAFFIKCKKELSWYYEEYSDFSLPSPQKYHPLLQRDNINNAIDKSFKDANRTVKLINDISWDFGIEIWYELAHTYGYDLRIIEDMIEEQEEEEKRLAGKDEYIRRIGHTSRLSESVRYIHECDFASKTYYVVAKNTMEMIAEVTKRCGKALSIIKSTAEEDPESFFDPYIYQVPVPDFLAAFKDDIDRQLIGNRIDMHRISFKLDNDVWLSPTGQLPRHLAEM